ncbi:MAG TPA: formylglycine-generating enzyme family protein [Actinomycetota bacterium]
MAHDAGSSVTPPPGVTPCCAATRSPGAPVAPPVGTHPAAGRLRRVSDTMVSLPGGPFLMGTDEIGFLEDGEGPVREVIIRPFAMDRLAVSNARFAEFVDATGYLSQAERFGSSFVFAGLVPNGFPQTRSVAGAEWWREVHGANWRHPAGPRSTIDESMDHPVIHVSWNDAVAFTRWAGLRLPTEAEWEYAARGGLTQKRFAWGDDLAPGGTSMCNIWQGTFPIVNTLEDGYFGTAPVDAFPPNAFGLHNVAGNVWEWCADWFSATTHRDGVRQDPTGPAMGVARVIRGGSYLCHESYCNRYRVAARSSNTPDSSTGNLGFRCARDLD